jgi:hypothetical protein
VTSAELGSPLRRLLQETAAEHGLDMKDLTVLAPQNDPFRVDTPARHRDGAWLAATIRELGLTDRKLYLRGLHYAVLGRPKPNGEPYRNVEEDWLWLSGDAGKAARWLGYLPFDQIFDQRNAAPDVRIFDEPCPRPYVSVGVDVDIPDADDIEPFVSAYYTQQGRWHSGFGGVQPYKLVLFGEKSSLADVLGPIATEYKADLYLPTGEISDTLLYQTARIGAEDGRPMVVLTFSDADPAGWQMPVSIARKLQAFKTLQFPDLEFQVRRVALTPDQAREYGPAIHSVEGDRAARGPVAAGHAGRADRDRRARVPAARAAAPDRSRRPRPVLRPDPRPAGHGGVPPMAGRGSGCPGRLAGLGPARPDPRRCRATPRGAARADRRDQRRPAHRRR